jgi:DNA polymerase III subunit alpha
MLRRFATHNATNLKQCEPNQEVFLGGMLTLVRFFNTKKARNGQSRYARFKLEDCSGPVECVMWPDDYVRYKELVEEDRVLFATGVVEKDRDEPIVQVTRLLTLDEGQKQRTTGLVLLLDLTEDEQRLAQVDSIARILQRAPGPIPVFLHVRDGAGKWLRLKAGEHLKINPATLPKGDLDTLLGPGRVEFARQR